jgi:GNAT superfamily N-acetyltransferase
VLIGRYHGARVEERSSGAGEGKSKPRYPVAAAVDESDDTIVGFTELVVPGDGKGDAQHYGTGVLPGRRGHGLGRWMKARSVLLARENHPDLAGPPADTADSNTHMRRINDEFGYEPTHKSVEYQLDL